MANIIVAFSRPEDGKSIKGILVRSGYDVAAVCMSGSQARCAAEGVGGGLVVCLPMPLKVHNLLSTLDMMVQAQQRIRRKLRSRPKERSKEEQDLINEAKALLMERNNMTESEAHRYIQKCSMDSGTNLVETSQMIISLIHV